MNFFSLPKDDELSDEVLSIFEAVNEQFTILPIFYRFLANAPPLMEDFWYSYKKVMLEGVLPQKIKELIFLVVARKQRCDYCAFVHLAICDIINIDRTTINAALINVTKIVPQRTALLLEFCLSTMDDPDAVNEPDFQRLYDAGINQREVAEALYTVSYANGAIFLAKMSKLVPDQSIREYLAKQQYCYHLKPQEEVPA